MVRISRHNRLPRGVNRAGGRSAPDSAAYRCDEVANLVDLDPQALVEDLAARTRLHFGRAFGKRERPYSARGWAVALVRYELLLLSQLGFGLDLSGCAVTNAGPEELAYVSPRTGAAVSVEGAQGYETQLLPLPPFLRDRTMTAQWPEIFDGFALTRHFLERSILIEKRADILASRDRLIDRLKRAVA